MPATRGVLAPKVSLHPRGCLGHCGARAIISVQPLWHPLHTRASRSFTSTACINNRRVSSSSRPADARIRETHVVSACAADDSELASENPEHTFLSKRDGLAAFTAFRNAAIATEAAHEQLLVVLLRPDSGPLGALLSPNPQLTNVAKAYGIVQAPHQKAVLQKLQQYGPAAVTLPGFA